MSDFIASLFGKPQSWYDRLGRDQAELSALLAELNSFGKSTWDEIQMRIAGAIRDGVYVPVERFTGFDWTTSDIIAQARNLIVTKSKSPTDAEIQEAEGRIALYRPMVEYAKQILPELASQVENDANSARGAVLKNTLRSPAEVGVETFYAEMDRRAGQFAAGAGTALAIVLAIAVALAVGGRR